MPQSDSGGSVGSIDVLSLNNEQSTDMQEKEYELHDNVCVDLTKYVRSNMIKNEEQFNLVTLGYLTGYMRDNDHYVSGVIVGTSSSGKTHLQSKVETLFDDREMYQATTGSDKSLIYDQTWEDSRIASLDEMQKPGEDLIEFLKSCHSDDEQFVYKVTGGDSSEGADRGTETIIRTAKPYWFLYAREDGGDDFELWNRLMKIPVYESESKNRAVGAYKHGHSSIQMGEEDSEYIGTFEAGTEALQDHFSRIANRFTERDEEGQLRGTAYVNLPTGGDGRIDVWDVLEPIYNHSRSEVNRVYSMASNLVRASALLNYQNREMTTEYIEDHGEIEVIQAEPQDVANVLRMRESLLSSTHELDRKKKAILAAIERKGGGSMECTLGDIQEYLKESDAPLLKRSELTAIMEDLRDNYMIEIHKDAAPDGKSDIYEFFGWDELQHARVEDYGEHFEDTHEPVGESNFLDWFRQNQGSLQSTAEDFIKHAGTEVSSSPDQDDESGPQRTLGGVDEDEGVDLEPHARIVHERVYDTLHDTVRDDLSEMTIEEMIDVDEPEGTVLDPEHEVWFQPDKPPEWVTSPKEAKRQVKRVIGRFIESGVIAADTRMEKGEVVEAQIKVLEP